VRIRVQLIRTATDQHIWAESYDREVGDVLQLENDVAREIAQQIGRVATGQPSSLARERLISTEAHENYLKGRYRWNQRTESGLRAGIEHFQKAIALQPKYAQAYAGLADCYIMMANWGFMASDEAYPKAEGAARQALELDDQLAEAQTSLAYATFLYDWDWPGSEQRFRRAIELDPNYATAHHFYSVYLMAAGRFAEAQVEIRRAQELDPLSLIINSVVGWIYYETRQYAQGIQQCERAVEMDPTYAPALLDLGTIYLKTGDYKKALVQFERARTIVGDKSVVLSYLAQVRALSGDKTGAQEILRKLENPSSPTFVSAWDLALIYIALGEKEKALADLEKAVDQHVGWVVRLSVDPALDTVRAEPRFKILQQRVHVPLAS
jgi:adenylate cyclase